MSIARINWKKGKKEESVMMNRRTFLTTSATAALGMMVPDSLLAAVKPEGGTLRFYHTHTSERMDIEYAPGVYTGSIRHAFEYFLRDFRTGETHTIDPKLFDTLCAIQQCCSRLTCFEVISGYRSPRTNEFLRKKGSGGVARKSLHMDGRAIDIRVTGLPTDMLKDLAINLHNGGVGYYPDSDFVHIDTGRKRAW